MKNPFAILGVSYGRLPPKGMAFRGRENRQGFFHFASGPVRGHLGLHAHRGVAFSGCPLHDRDHHQHGGIQGSVGALGRGQGLHALHHLLGHGHHRLPPEHVRPGHGRFSGHVDPGEAKIGQNDSSHEGPLHPLRLWATGANHLPGTEGQQHPHGGHRAKSGGVAGTGRRGDSLPPERCHQRRGARGGRASTGPRG